MHDLSYYSMGKQIKRYESIGRNEITKVEMHTFRTTDFSRTEPTKRGECSITATERISHESFNVKYRAMQRDIEQRN